MRYWLATMAAGMLILSACGTVVGDGGAIAVAPPGTESVVPAVVSSTTEQQPSNPSETGPEPATPSGTEVVEIFLIQDSKWSRAVTRPIEPTVGVASAAIEALISGPTDDESAAGLSTSVPADTLLLGLKIDGGRATVDLSQEFERGGGSFAILTRLAQVVYTLTQFETVTEVVFHIDGHAISTFSGEGVILDDPVDRSDYIELLPTDSPAPLWTQSELPSTAGVVPEFRRRVVLVAADDVLNVRSGIGVDFPILGMLNPGVAVRLTGEQGTTGASVWSEIVTPDSTGWVNAHFLGADVSAPEFSGDPDIDALLDRFATLMADRGDLTPVVSKRGLFVAHFAPLMRFHRDQLGNLLRDTTTYKWGSAALGPDDPELRSATFADEVGARFVSTYADPDRSLIRNQAELGGNGTPAEFAIPNELKGFNFVSVFDQGDDPQYEGLDWTAWYVSIDYEDGKPVVVALTLNEWAP